MSCSTTTRAWRWLSSAIRSTSRSTSSSVMPAAGSSSRIRSGSGAITMASSTSWRWPCASWPTMRWAIAVMPTRSIASSVRRSAMRPGRHLGGRRPHIVARRQAVEHVGHLGLDADAQAGDGVRADAGDRRAAEQDLAAGRPQLAGQALEEGALARAVRPDHAAQLDLLQGEVDMVDGDDAAEAHRQSPGLEERRRRHGLDVPVRPSAAGAAARARPRGEAGEPPPGVGHQRGQAPWAPAGRRSPAGRPARDWDRPSRSL